MQYSILELWFNVKGPLLTPWNWVGSVQISPTSRYVLYCTVCSNGPVQNYCTWLQKLSCERVMWAFNDMCMQYKFILDSVSGGIWLYQVVIFTFSPNNLQFCWLNTVFTNNIYQIQWMEPYPFSSVDERNGPANCQLWFDLRYMDIFYTCYSISLLGRCVTAKIPGVIWNSNHNKSSLVWVLYNGSAYQPSLVLSCCWDSVYWWRGSYCCSL